MCIAMAKKIENLQFQQLCNKYFQVWGENSIFVSRWNNALKQMVNNLKLCFAKCEVD